MRIFKRLPRSTFYTDRTRWFSSSKGQDPGSQKEEKCTRDEPSVEQSEFNTPTVNEDARILSQCGCSYLAMEARNLVYKAPAFSLLQTKDLGLDYLAQLMDLLEEISLCEKFSNVKVYRAFLQPLCHSILGLCRLFYRSLREMYNEMDMQPVSLKGKEAVVDERPIILCQKAYHQIERLHNSDAWKLIDSGAYRLVVCTASLSGFDSDLC
ncbi:hypothetical protein BDV33DRAFT_191097 [Aspergillus novoparasiticus]|uniref:Uncharacterized protein n=1 Tax=Aspergillus novoparasiticus TaxID=986946 RepID=A0A5N6ET07_9EURO|nr:hypothetical protein BDV33DRAFT_191097 [Aspergillus novoparasiticus]